MLSFREVLPHIGKAALGGAFFYFVALAVLSMAGQLYSSWPDWIFRLSLLGVSFYIALRLRIVQKGMLSFPQGFFYSALTALLVALSMGISQYVIYEQIETNYHSNANAVYAENRRMQMQSSRAETLRKENKSDELSLEDKAKIEESLEKHLASVEFYFTTWGAVLATWLFSLFWILGISFSVAIFLRQQ